MAPAHTPPRDAPPRRVRLSAGELEVHVVGPEGAPVVVLLHGIFVGASTWRHVVAQLAGRFRCVVPELPFGCHRVPLDDAADLAPAAVADLVAELLEALDLRDVTLVGSDSGGATAQLVAARHPARLGRLVLATCDALECFPPRMFAYLRLVGFAPWLGGVLARLLLAFPALARLPLAYGAGSATPVPRDVLRAWLTPLARDRGVQRDLAKFLRGVRPEVTLGAAEALRAFRAPVLLVWGTAQRVFPVSLAERLASKLPDARLERVEDARAFVQEDRPEVLVAALERLVDGAPRAVVP